MIPCSREGLLWQCAQEISPGAELFWRSHVARGVMGGCLRQSDFNCAFKFMLLWVSVCARIQRSSETAAGYTIVRKPKLYRMIFFGCKWSPGELSGSVWISVTEGRRRMVGKEDLCVLWVCVFIARICLCGFWRVRSMVVKPTLSVFDKLATGGQNNILCYKSVYIVVTGNK